MRTPEEAELAKKQAELERLSNSLAEKELALEELNLSIERFQHRYYSELGKKYVELDELRAQIAEIKAKQKPHDHKLKQEATRARTQAKKAAEEYEDIGMEPPADSKKSEELEDAKKLYRKIAAIVHPDKATDEKTRHIRTSLMAELNEAYARKDMAKMQEILDKWQESPEAVAGEDTASELVRTIRAIAKIKRRISDIGKEISKIMASDLNVLMLKVHDADLVGRNILAETAVCIDAGIQEARHELASLKKAKHV